MRITSSEPSALPLPLLNFLISRNGFVDADSGISHYLWSINTSNSAFTALPAARSIRADLNTACTTLTTPLPHGVTVYSTIVAVHASAGQLSTTATSNGGRHYQFINKIHPSIPSISKFFTRECLFSSISTCVISFVFLSSSTRLLAAFAIRHSCDQ